MPQSIQLSHITKGFGTTHVLQGIDLTIEPGEFVSLVGMSGCGKSTLLRVIAGLESPTEGQVHIGGVDVTQDDPSDRNLAMVFQSYALYPHMTVRQNIATPLRMRQLSLRQRLPLIGKLLTPAPLRRAIDTAVAEAADSLQISALLDRKPGQLSGGQRQRVALARALVRNPAAFLMDEPLSNLDAKLRAHMREELVSLHKSLGATFIYVTHDQIEAMTMSDRIALMSGGQIAQVGTPDQLYHAPATLTVARFIGSPTINLLPAEADGAGRVRVFGHDIGLTTTARGPVTLGVRAEGLHDAPQGLRLTVLRCENHGADRFVSCALCDDDTQRVTLRQSAPTPGPAVGDHMQIGIDARAAHVFDADGNRCRTQACQQVAA
ncbi:glycerol-3-phosphate ABC transporter ATP-binding protein [Thioclava sp. SK-1]|uniref:ABC transporter ATP-binding protein n=1 Tax=Thioclava sp. SK-1 TaxID=1889770 RepID=UPI0008267723|nr:ABC transporter ATP-binding protein [Thioclava sp. SK-1]OCX63793.1 glycerol-3-phosphate ABC transporter ATP-binding protein [Thioclava sp. SK-1]